MSARSPGETVFAGFMLAWGSASVGEGVLHALTGGPVIAATYFTIACFVIGLAALIASGGP